MVPGEIYLSHFPYGGSAGMKPRPTLVLAGPVGTIPEVLVAYISSVIPATPLPSDIVLGPSLPENACTNLKVVSVVRLHKLATIHQRSVLRYLGKVSPATEAEVATKLRQLLNL